MKTSSEATKMNEKKQANFSISGVKDGGVLTESAQHVNPAEETATVMFQMAPGMLMPFEFGGVKEEIAGYRDSAWIGTTLMISPVVDIIGPDAVKFLNSICVNDFSKLDFNGIRHAMICNDKGQLLTDGVVLRIGDDRYRTYWLNPPIQYYAQTSGMDVTAEDMSGQEYFIQIDGERSLEILEDAFGKDLHDIKFTKHRMEDMDGRQVRVLRLGMSGNLAYEIHGPVADYDYVYRKVWESGQKFGARKLGMHAYNEFNHTEAGFPNIHLHYPLPWFESDEGLAQYLYANPMLGSYDINRKLTGSVGEDLESRFVTPYDVGWGFIVNFNHDFRGKEALEKIAEQPPRTVTTLEWTGEDVGKVFATMFTPGEEPCDDISKQSDSPLSENSFNGWCEYRADKVFAGDTEIGITAGRIISYNYNSMISLGFIDPEFAKEGQEVEILWGTPGTRQMKIRAKVARYPYNKDLVRNEDRNTDDIPRLQK